MIKLETEWCSRRGMNFWDLNTSSDSNYLDLIFSNLFYLSELASEKWEENNSLLREIMILKNSAQ